MKNRFQLVLSLSVFAILLVGFISYSLWVENIMYKNLKQQALDDNLTIGKSVLSMIDKSKISPDNKVDFIKLVQETCDVLKIPNRGFICMADSMGTLLAAPGLKPDNKVSISSAQFLTVKRKKTEKYADFFKSNPFIGYYEYSNHKYSDVLVAMTHSYSGYKILVHQDANMIKKQANEKSLPLLWVGITFAFFVSLLAYFAISRQVAVYQVKIKSQNTKLEQSNDEIQAKNSTLEQQNIQLKELAEEKDILLGIMAHDLRNPLGGIQSVVSLIDKIGDLSEEQKIYFSLLQPQVESAQQLIDDVLEMNTLENNQKKVEKTGLNLSQFMIDKIKNFKLLADEKNIQLELIQENDNTKCHTSLSELNRITDNLLSNAIKYTAMDKTVSIAIQTKEDRIDIQFIDQGAGIPENELNLLFKKFSKLSTRPTNEESSTGLGLYIVKLLSEKIDGKLNVESEVGKGSIFSINIPMI